MADIELDLREYEEAKNLRSGHHSDWRTAASHCLPEQYARWLSEGSDPVNTSDMRAARRIAYDSTGLRSLPKYQAVLERIATPAGQNWNTLTASNVELRRNRNVQLYFDQVTHILAKERSMPAAMFQHNVSDVYGHLGVYGNGPMFVGKRRGKYGNPSGMRYIACSMQDIFWLIDDEGQVCIVFRRLWLNVRKFKARFPDAPLPSAMASEGAKAQPNERALFEIVHVVRERPEADYDPEALNALRFPISGRYFCVKSREYIGGDQAESGYAHIPYVIPRVHTVAGDPFGYSPAVRAIPALGGASVIKKAYLKQGNKAVDPVLLTHDDGVLSGEIDQRPGAVNPGGVNAQGQSLIQALPTGNFRIAEVMLQDERADIEDAFFVTLFKILEENPELTATQVVEMAGKEVALMAPTLGRLQSGLLGPTLDREIDVLSELGRLPEMPPELVEAEGEYEVIYTSPMARSLQAEEASGFMRAVEWSLNIAATSGNPNVLDHYDFDTATPEIADIMAVPARWMASEEKVAETRQARAEQMEQDQMIQNASGLAAAGKVAMEAGEGTGP